MSQQQGVNWRMTVIWRLGELRWSFSPCASVGVGGSSVLSKTMVVVTGNFELAVDPPVEVVPFSGALGGGVQQQLTLTNNAGYQLAFKVKCTDNNVIKIDNAAGLLPVGQSANVVFSSGPLPGPPPPQNIYIMNVPAEGAPDAQSAFAAAPEGSGKVELDAAFD